MPAQLKLHAHRLQMMAARETGMNDPDWLALCRRAVKSIESVIAKMPRTQDRNRQIGTGAGGDRTLIIDKQADYILALKGNQGYLKEDVQNTFLRQQPDSTDETVEKAMAG